MINLYAMNPDDPQYLLGLAYLQSLGAPPPTLTTMQFAYPGSAVYDIYTAEWGGGSDSGAVNGVSALIGEIAAFPNVVANNLNTKGIIKLAGPLPDMPPPSVVPHPVATTAPLPASPVGPRQRPGTPDAIGDTYYMEPGFHFADGQLITVGAYTFKANIKLGFAGYSDWWERTA
jgi:hypothetical protein